MRKGRPPSAFEDLGKLTGFRVTAEQLEWLREASIAAGDLSLAEFLRRVAVESGVKLLSKPFPRRKLIGPPKPKRK